MAPIRLTVVAALCCATITSAINNGLGRAPYLGWSTWCTGGPCERDVCSEEELKSIAQSMIDSGLRDAGWNSINMDDCWEASSRDSTGRLMANSSRFPSGMRALTDWLHAKGFLAGTYVSLGYATCHRAPDGLPIPGSYGSFALDAHTLVVEWQFDYIKGDWCETKNGTSELDIGNTTNWMAAELNATGVPNRFTFHGVAGFPWTVNNSNSARVYSDHHDEWSSSDLSEGGTGDVIGLMAVLETPLYAGVQPADVGGGYWFPDYDVLMTGGQGCPDAPPLNETGPHCPGQTDVEYKTEFSFWAMGSSVLVFATDPRNLTQVMRDVLFNWEIIGVNQDGTPGVALKAFVECGTGLEAPCQVWSRVDSNGTTYALVYNPNGQQYGNTSGVAFNFSTLGLADAESWALRDLWLHEDIGTYTGGYTTRALQPHETLVFKITPAHAAALPLAPPPSGSLSLLAAVDTQGYPNGYFLLYNVTDMATGAATQIGMFGSIPDADLSGMLAAAPARGTVYLAAGEGYSANTSAFIELHLGSGATKVLNTGISISAMEYDAKQDAMWAVWQGAGVNIPCTFGWLDLGTGKETAMVDLSGSYSIPWATFGVSAFDASRGVFYFLVGIEGTSGQSFAVASVDVSKGVAAPPAVTLGAHCNSSITIQSLAFDTQQGLLATIMSPSVYKAGETVTYTLVAWDLDRGQPVAGGEGGLAQWSTPSTEYNTYQPSAYADCNGIAGYPCSAGSEGAFVTADPFQSPTRVWSFRVPQAGHGGLPVNGTGGNAAGIPGQIWDFQWMAR